MALLPILKYPDPRLATKAAVVTEFDDKLKQLAADTARSEEHTSELQSRGSVSYAVCCLKKKTRS